MCCTTLSATHRHRECDQSVARSTQINVHSTSPVRRRAKPSLAGEFLNTKWNVLLTADSPAEHQLTVCRATSTGSSWLMITELFRGEPDLKRSRGGLRRFRQPPTAARRRLSGTHGLLSCNIRRLCRTRSPSSSLALGCSKCGVSTRCTDRFYHWNQVGSWQRRLPKMFRPPHGVVCHRVVRSALPLGTRLICPQGNTFHQSHSQSRERST